MQDSALDAFIERTRSAWGPLSSELIDAVRDQLRRLLEASPSEDWLAALRNDRPANRELHRDPDHGFVLLGHTEPGGLYRPPHDHGRSWVMYAVLEGEIEMGTYGLLDGAETGPRLVKRGSSLLRAGEMQAYLPGDIHDTRCVSRSALLLRFTERDLKQDVGHPVTRYAFRDGRWTMDAPA